MREEETKFVPVTVKLNAAPPAGEEFGDSDEIAGAGLSAVKVAEPEIPPPGGGVETVTATAVALAISEAAICACNCVLETKVVERALPFHWTVELAMKFVPFTVKVKAAPPTVTEVGLKEETVGSGLGGGPCFDAGPTP